MPVVCQAFPLDQRLLATAVAAPAALLAAWLLFKGLATLRRGDKIARFFARAIIFGAGAGVFARTMVAIGGVCVFAGPTKGGGFNSTPFSSRSLVGWVLGIGIAGALLAPAVWEARGKKLEW